MTGNRFGSGFGIRAATAAVVAAIAMPCVTLAQQGGIMGTIVADSGGKPVGGATIRLPQLNRGARTNWTGDFVIEQLPGGKYYAIVEAPGFAAESVDVELPTSGTINHDFKLKRAAAGAAVVVGAGSAPSAEPVTMSARLQAFEKRRSENKGLYVTRDKLAKGGRLIDMLRPVIHGARFQSFPDGSTKLVSTRQTGATSLSDQSQQQPCFVQVWVDGTAIGGGNAGANAPSMALGGRTFQGSATLQTGEMGLDFNPLESSQYDAIEYYADPGSTPPEYRANGARCGTLLLWTHVE